MGYVWTGGKNGNRLLSCQRKTDSCGWGIEKKEKSIVSVHVRSFKMKYVCNYCVQRCDIYVPIPSICNQLIPITDINLSIDCYCKSIPIDNHTNLAIDGPSIIHININWLIDIDWHRLLIIDWIPWDSTTHDIICAKNTSWLQSAGICNETNAQKRHTRVYEETFDVNS